MEPYATISDVIELFRTLTPEEVDRANALLPIVSDLLRQEAMNVGKNLDDMIKGGKVLTGVARSVTVDIVARALMTSTDSEPMTQYSESALGYTTSGTFLCAGGGIFIKSNELSRLGLKRQRASVISLC